MRLGALAGLAGLLLSAPAGADPFYTWQKLTLQFTNLGGAKASSTATGMTMVYTSSSFSSHLSSISLQTQSLVSSVPVTDPHQAPITSAIFDLRNRPDLQGGGLIGNVSGAIGGGGALTPNTIPMSGGVVICLLTQYDCPFLSIDLPMGGTRSGGWVGNGIGGILTIGGSGSLRISLVGAPYTVRTVSAAARTTNGGIDIITALGFAHGPLSQTSSTAETSGVLQIVTAAHVTSAGVAGSQDIAGAISTTLVHLIHVPEPAMPLLLGSGAAFLALLGYRRRRQ